VTDQELKKLNRQDLLRLLLETERENERLRSDLNVAKKMLNDRKVTVSEAGNLAEASLRLSGVFEDAQRAADIYIQNAEQVCEEQKRQATELKQATERSCREMKESCQADCDRLREEAKKWAADYRQKVVQPLKEYVRSIPDFFGTNETE
jgi:hypothetical protein